MTRLPPIVGGWYADCLPGREYAVFMTGADPHLQTHVGRIELPGEGLLYVRVTNVGGFGICGQGWQSGKAWLWRNGAWTEQGPAHGTSPCIFDLQGNLLVIRPGADVTSQGYRYVDANGRAWLGDETYTKVLDDGQLIHEYTEVADVTIGQGHEHGTQVFLAGQRRLLEAGATTFVRVREQAGQFSIALVKPGAAGLIWATRAELAQLPLVLPEKPPVDRIDPPRPPEKPMQIPQKVKDNIRALYERNKPLARGTDDDRRALMKLINEQNRFDLGPSWGWKSADPGRPPGKDAIAHAEHGNAGDVWVADVFSGSTREPSIPDEMELTNPRQNFIAVEPIQHIPPPADDLKARPDSFESSLQQHVQALEERVERVERRLQALEDRPTG